MLADLRTASVSDHEREKQNLERFDTLRRIAESARFAGNNMTNIQAIRDSFLPPGGFSVPLTAPLGIPASDLARIAQQVPDPAANGEATSGTGRIRVSKADLNPAIWHLSITSFEITVEANLM